MLVCQLGGVGMSPENRMLVCHQGSVGMSLGLLNRTLVCRRRRWYVAWA